MTVQNFRTGFYIMNIDVDYNKVVKKLNDSREFVLFN